MSAADFASLGIAAYMLTLTGGTKLREEHMRPCRKRLSLTLLAGSIGVACSVALLAVALAQEAAPLPPQLQPRFHAGAENAEKETGFIDQRSSRRWDERDE